MEIFCTLYPLDLRGRANDKPLGSLDQIRMEWLTKSIAEIMT